MIAGWDPARATRFMRAWCESLRREAAYLEDNAEDMALSEEEFRLVLEHGLGLTDDAIEEACADAQAVSCRVCGCTDDRACPGGCSWVEPDLCSRCVGKAPEAAAAEERMRELVVGAYLVLSCHREMARRFVARDLREGLAETLTEADPRDHPPGAVRRYPGEWPRGARLGLVEALDGRVVLVRSVDGTPIPVSGATGWAMILAELGIAGPAARAWTCPVVIQQPEGADLGGPPPGGGA